MSLLAKAAGIGGVEGTGGQRDADKWNAVLSKDPRNKGLSFENFTQLPVNKFESGDLIVWSGHDGIIVGGGKKMYLLQSNGSDGRSHNYKDQKGKSYKKSCVGAGGVIDRQCVKDAQEANRGKNRGPRMIDITTALTYWPGSYTILRLVTDVSGTWQLLGRCAGEERDAIDIILEISKETKQESDDKVRKISVSTTATDYDGSALTISVEGEYNKETNRMKANVAINGEVGETRIDAFDQDLNMDDTGYFPATKVQINNGCDVEWRLINKSNEKSDGGRKSAIVKDFRGVTGTSLN